MLYIEEMKTDSRSCWTVFVAMLGVCWVGKVTRWWTVGEAVREVNKLMCKGHAALSPSLGLYYSTPVPRPLSQEVSCLPVSTPGLCGPWMPFQELEMGLGQPLGSSALTHRFHTTGSSTLCGLLRVQPTDLESFQSKFYLPFPFSLDPCQICGLRPQREVGQLLGFCLA